MAKYKVPLQGALLVEADSPEAAVQSAEQFAQNMPIALQTVFAFTRVQGCTVHFLPDSVEPMQRAETRPAPVADW